MSNGKILIADDDDAICNLIRLLLEKEDYETVTASNGQDAYNAVTKANDFDLIILDIVMPMMFGTDAAKEIRKKTNCPIMFLTARSTDEDKIEAYNSGGDDYLQKPFSTVELMLRVKALIKRSGIKKSEASISLSEKAVIVDGKKSILTDREFELFECLYKNKGKVLDIKTIYEMVWHDKYLTSSNNTVMVFILNLRKKIESDYAHPRHIITVWGKGYSYAE